MSGIASADRLYKGENLATTVSLAEFPQWRKPE